MPVEYLKCACNVVNVNTVVNQNKYSNLYLYISGESHQVTKVCILAIDPHFMFENAGRLYEQAHA